MQVAGNRFGQWMGWTGVLCVILAGLHVRAQVPTGHVRVVATLTNYAFVARYIGGPHVDVVAIADGRVDPHFVKPKPSYAVRIRNADLFISTGLDLELWEPALLARAGNARVMPGRPGYVAVSRGIRLLEKPVSASRAEGDIHIYGNPHVYTSPYLMKKVAENIAQGLIRIDPAHRATYEQNLQRFKDEIDRRLFGKTLVRMLGGALLDRLIETGRLEDVLTHRTYRGKPLKDYLGGWLGAAWAIRGRALVCYHKNWIYFATLFGLRIANYVEPKPGIPPTPQHVAEVIAQMRNENLRVLLAAAYFDRGKVLAVADRAGAVPVIVPMGVTDALPTYFDVVDHWVRSLVDAFTRADATAQRAQQHTVDVSDGVPVPAIRWTDSVNFGTGFRIDP